jgi:AraC family transcriptional regulator, transcriptional activator of pobA
MEHLTTIPDYCRHIHVPQPRHPQFDIRPFSDNMPTVLRHMAPFRHEFYVIGLLLEGTSHVWGGIPNLRANILFNSPYQLISWEIENDWDGYYLVFTQDFLMQCHFADSLLTDFPFLKLDEVRPITVPSDQLTYLQRKFEQMHEEYVSGQADKFKFIESYLNLLLLSIKRFVGTSQAGIAPTEQNRTNDVKLIARYQTLIESALNQPDIRPDYFATSYYADLLAVHPNHLNALSRRITGKTAKQVIQERVVLLAKSLLTQSDLSVKEIAYRLGYEEATHFSSFFKKATQLTPLEFKALHRPLRRPD